MRLICPNCVAQYEVDDNVIPPEGRDVQCANCGHNWFQDTVQMLSSDADISSGTGDPDSDVPPELFNDLEGKLDTAFVSTRRATAPDPNDMEPETPRDDFQIERAPAAPSSKIGQDALDILHAEAEYSSGEKPPAAAGVPEDAEAPPPLPPVETPDEAPLAHVEETSYIPTEDPVEVEQVEEVEEPVAETPPAVEVDDLDEIRRRIMELEAQGPEPVETAPQAPTEAPEVESPSIRDLPSLEQAPAGNPFSHPAATGNLYEENIPVEETASPPAPAGPDKALEGQIQDLVSAQDIPDNALARPARKVAARPFPNIGDTDDLYGASDDSPPEGQKFSRKDMFPDVDELSSEIANEAEQDPQEHHPAATTQSPQKAKSSFMKGFNYALLLCISIGILYMLQPMILRQIPQLEGFFNIITIIVDTLISLVGPMIETTKDMITGMMGSA